MKVILASASPRRRELLNLIGIAHEVRPADIDESILAGELPVPHAERLAVAKAITVSQHEQSSLVIGADTIVVVDGEVLGKPRDKSDAHRMLRILSGREHMVVTAVAVAIDGRVVSSVEQVRVSFRDLSDLEISEYIATGEPMDKAGSYGIQGFGATIVRRVDGDYFAVMGLALVRLVTLIQDIGLHYSFAAGVTSQPWGGTSRSR